MSIKESSNGARARDYGGSFAALYRRYARDRIKRPINRQRLKLAYDIWWYYPILGVRSLRLRERINLLWKFVRIDWFVLHGSKPAEVVPVMIDLMTRHAGPREVFVEAGCWNGGSAAKFSLVCKLFGYELHVFDSFQGVEEWGFAYAAKEADVRENLSKYGALDVCTLHPGWFRDTLWNRPVPFPVRMVYIDCDVAQGSIEVLSGILPGLVADGVVYTQDYRIKAVRRVIDDPKTWTDLGVGVPQVEPLIRNLARITWNPGSDFARTGTETSR